MSLPFHFAARNLSRKPVQTLQKVLGATLVVLLVLSASSFNTGMEQVLAFSGSPRNVILLGTGSEESIERSEIAVSVETLAKTAIRSLDQRGPMAPVSGEVHTWVRLKTTPDKSGEEILARGITPSALEVHQSVRLIEGRFPRSGEIMIGRMVPEEFSDGFLKVGSQVRILETPFEVSGIFDAPGSVLESEIWMNRNDLMTLSQRTTLSGVFLRLSSLEDFREADLFAKQRLDLELTALRESDYYQQLASLYAPVRGLTWLTALMVAAGAVFGGINMLYASFSSRSRELASLQAMGFSRRAIGFSLMTESLLATLSGTIIAAWIALLILQGLAVSFSMGAFELDFSPGVLAIGWLTGILLGALGSLPPAWHCLAKPLPTALRS